MPTEVSMNLQSNDIAIDFPSKTTKTINLKFVLIYVTKYDLLIFVYKM